MILSGRASSFLLVSHPSQGFGIASCHTPQELTSLWVGVTSSWGPQAPKEQQLLGASAMCQVPIALDPGWGALGRVQGPLSYPSLLLGDHIDVTLRCFSPGCLGKGGISQLWVFPTGTEGHFPESYT